MKEKVLNRLNNPAENIIEVLESDYNKSFANDRLICNSVISKLQIGMQEAMLKVPKGYRKTNIRKLTTTVSAMQEFREKYSHIKIDYRRDIEAIFRYFDIKVLIEHIELLAEYCEENFLLPEEIMKWNVNKECKVVLSEVLKRRMLEKENEKQSNALREASHEAYELRQEKNRLMEENEKLQIDKDVKEQNSKEGVLVEDLPIVRPTPFQKGTTIKEVQAALSKLSKVANDDYCQNITNPSNKDDEENIRAEKIALAKKGLETLDLTETEIEELQKQMEINKKQFMKKGARLGEKE